MRRFFATLLAALMLVSMIPVSAMALESVTTLNSKQDLLDFAELVNNGQTYAGEIVRLGADIDLAGIEWQPIGGGSVYFAGEFDGNGKTISNLTNTEDVARKGLFGLVEKCYIHDLTLKNVKFSGTASDMRVGALAGNLQYYNVIENVTIDGLDYDLTDTDGLIGGLAGYAWTSYVKNCTVKNATMDITSSAGSSVGAMLSYGRGVGDPRTNFPYADKIAAADYQGESVWNYVDCKVEGAKLNVSGTVTAAGFLGSDTYNHWRNYAKNCTVTGLEINCAAGDGVYTVGGFMGGQYGGYDPAAIKDCSVDGTITSAGTNPASSYGGFMGYKGGRPGGATGCTANVDINVGAGDVGGFVAETQQYFAHAYAFDGCAAEGDVSTDDGVAGGFIASIQHGGDGNALNVSISNSSASGSVTGTTASGFAGVVNDNKNSTHTGGTVTITDSIATLAPVTGDKVSNFVTKTEGMADDVVSHAGEVVTPNDMLTGEKDNIEVTDDNQPLKITWKHEDGETLATTYILPGEIPEYDGETPTKDSDDEYNYVFAGWTPGVSEVSGDTTYTAKFEAVKIEEETPVRDSFFPFIVTGVTQVKVIDAETEAALEGATFELYRISSTGSRKLHGTYTSNATGRITARTLSPRFTYELVMTSAPEGYDLLEAPVVFRVQYNRPLQQVVPVTKTVVEEAPVETPAA